MFKQVFFGVIWFYISVAEGTQVSQPEVIVASRHGNAKLVCGYNVQGKVEEIRFSLMKKTNSHVAEICSFSYSIKYEPVTSGKDIQCLGIPGPQNVTYHISGLQAEDTGLYFCKLEVMYPPPYWTTKGNATLIYVSDLTSQCAESVEQDETKSYESVLLPIFLLMVLYSSVVTFVLLLKRRKQRWETGYYEQILQSNYKSYPPYYIRI